MPWGRMVGIKCVGEAIAFSCLTRGEMGFVLAKLHIKDIYEWEIYI